MAFALSKVRSVGLLTNSTSPIAIDFGVGSLKLLQIGIGEENSLIAAAQAEVPDDIQTDHTKRLDFQAEALARIIRGGAFKGKRAMCAIPASQVFCRHLQFPKSETDIPGAVEAAIPAMLGCHPDALVYRHAVVSGTSGAASALKHEVISFAVPRELIRRVMEAQRACKLEPVGIHPAALATMRGFDVLSRREQDKDLISAYIDLGAGSTTCMIAHGKEMVFAKTIHIGGRHLDDAAAHQLKCGVTWARTQRHAAVQIIPTAPAVPESSGVVSPQAGSGAAAAFDPSAPIQKSNDDEAAPHGVKMNGVPASSARAGGVGDAKAVRLNLEDQVGTLADELWMCLRYHAALFPDKKISRVIMVGGEARDTLLTQTIAARLSIPVQVADPLSLLAKNGTEVVRDVDVKQPLPGWTTALGLCLSQADL